MKVVFNNKDLQHMKEMYGEDYLNDVLSKEEIVEYCMLFSGKYKKNLKNILSGDLEIKNNVKRDFIKNPNFVLTPCYSDKNLGLFEEYGQRKLIDFQDNCCASKITIVLNKSISVQSVISEYNYVINTLKKEVSFLVDSKISKKKMIDFLNFVKKIEVNFIRLRWRGKIDTVRKLLVIKEIGGIKVNISNLNSNLGISDRKTGKRISCIVLFTLFRNIIDSSSRGISQYIDTPEFPIYKYNPENWEIELTSYSTSRTNYLKSRVKLIETLNYYADSYFDKVSSNQFSQELEKRNIFFF